MKNAVIIIFIVISFFTQNLFAEENLKKESESLAYAWFLGASFSPVTEIYFGDPDSNDNRDQKLNWGGHGFSIKSMYITGFYSQYKYADLFFSLNTNVSYIFWNEKQLLENENNEEVTHRFNGDKGYSVIGSQTFRMNILFFQMFGAYVDLGANFHYLNPKEIVADENINEEFMGGLYGGIGFYYYIPFSSPIILEAGFNTANLFRKGNNSTAYYFSAEISCYFEFY